MHKYPRTYHIEGSRLQPGDQGMGEIPFSTLKKRYLVVEEKCDGANAGISFSKDKKLLLQSRGHYLTGGGREKHFNLFKSWASSHQKVFWELLEDRYVLYGEWVYAKHTVFYDRLPHYFLEFDILDTQTKTFLSTEKRRKLLKNLPIVSVPVLWEGRVDFSLETLINFVKPSCYKSEKWKETFSTLCEEHALSKERAWKETDISDFMEGLYLKIEEEGKVIERYKYIRASFLTAVVDSGTHWLNRPIIPNQLADGVELF